MSLTLREASASDRVAPAFDRSHVDLERAIEALDAALQPIVDINSGALFGCEVLVRNIDRLGFKRPADLFDWVAGLGELALLEERLLGKALSKIAGVERFRDAILFVNIDGRSLQDHGRLVQGLMGAIRRAGYSANDICIELSEKNQTLSSPEFTRAIAELKRLGFRIAIDDFGTGYSGLQMLYQTSPDFIKIDRFFIENLNLDPKKRFFVKSLSAIAHTLGIRVIAEGVETAAEHHFARDMQCDLMQGYFIGHPTTDAGQIPGQVALVAGNIDRRVDKSDVFLGDLMMPFVPIQLSGTLDQTFAVLLDNPRQSMVPVVDKRNAAIGAIFEADIKSIMFSKFGRDLMRNKCFASTLGEFVKPMKIVDIRTSSSTFMDYDFEQIKDGVIVTSNSQYAGVLLPSAILSITHSHQLRETRRQNPLSRLPGNDAIREYLQSIERSPVLDKALVYFDFDSFKPFNDKYGFRQGDRAILLFSEMLRATLQGGDVFVGHIGGDDFFVGAMGVSSQTLATVARSLQARFRKDVESFYAPEDRAAGYILGKTRDGSDATFPLMTCSAGMLTIAAGVIAPSSDAMAEHLARCKKAAKSSPDRFHLEAVTD